MDEYCEFLQKFNDFRGKYIVKEYYDSGELKE